MTAYEMLVGKIRVGMVEGTRHLTRRDVGALAGGYLATGAITRKEADELKSLVISLSSDGWGLGEKEWEEAIRFGQQSPLSWDQRRKRQNKAFDWNDTIDDINAKNDFDAYQIVDNAWLEEDFISEPSDSWDGKEQVRRYIETLFDREDFIGYCVESIDRDGRFAPANKGIYTRTAGQILDALNATNDPDWFPIVFGQMNHPESGVWIRPNPLDGKGIRDENVTHFRYALIECDDMAVEKQSAIIRKLELPVAIMVHSGGKSLHAIVRVDASSLEEYRSRVDFLYGVCAKNGLTIDKQNRNPSRLSRMPGVKRGDRKQFIVAQEIGKSSYDEWKEWVDSVNDDLPDIEAMSEDLFLNLPIKAPELIEGVLREGHKMRLAGPSKAGKSFALIELAIAIAEGDYWFGWKCSHGSVLYVNLEVDRASCLHRIADVYSARGLQPRHADMIHVWNLRGHSEPLDKLAPRLIRRAKDVGYKAVIIDPIYKILTGDENNASDMAIFCNQFDKIATELKCAVIDCHHHSKGAQGGKFSQDRASGSGVFARDPDALLDIVELEADEALVAFGNGRYWDFVNTWMSARVGSNWAEELSMDDFDKPESVRRYAYSKMDKNLYAEFSEYEVRENAQNAGATAWRLSGVLREFAGFKPRDMFFRYPLHILDTGKLLANAKVPGEEPPWMAERRARQKSANDKKAEEKRMLAKVIVSGTTTLEELSSEIGVSNSTAFRRLKKHGYLLKKGVIYKNED